MKLLQDSTGLYFAVSSPYLPIIARPNVNLLSEAKTRLSQEQTQVEIFEVGTGNLVLKLDMRMHIRDLAWSYCGRYISVCGTQPTSSSRLSVLPRSIQESIYNMLDALRCDKKFWDRFTIDLTLINAKAQEVLKV